MPKKGPSKGSRPTSSTAKAAPSVHPAGGGGGMIKPIAFSSIGVLLLALLAYNFAGNRNDLVVLQPLIPKPTQHDPFVWFTHRAQLYFGLRTRHPNSPQFGMIWFEQPDLQVMPNVRHWCRQEDRLHEYAWDAADGRTFGRQHLNDTSVSIYTDWINNGHSFTAKIRSVAHNKENKTKRINFFFYLTMPNIRKGSFRTVIGEEVHIVGNAPDFGDLRLDINYGDHKTVKPYISELVMRDPRTAQILDMMFANMRGTKSDDGLLYLLYDPNPDRMEGGNNAILQLNLPLDAELEVTLTRGDNTEEVLTGDAFDSELNRRVSAFEEKFNRIFDLDSKEYSEVEKKMGRVALSNMLGSIGLWNGYNRVDLGKGTIGAYGPHELLSAVPSRPFFPRGFLWDEGFHQLLISRFDPEYSLEIIVSWLNTMNVNGWIPREMILGEEAEARVPEEFVVQHPDVANPPSFFYLVESILQNKEFVEKHRETFSAMFVRLQKWYWWLSDSQKGEVRGTFRWRGRNATTTRELNPKTLASGLDDYPRASHPTDSERHVDLLCWLTVATRVMAALSKQFDPSQYNKYKKLEESYSFERLVQLHWDPEAKIFADWGLHSTSVSLETRVDPKTRQESTARRVHAPPVNRFVSDAVGYITLFPLITRIIPPQSEHLKHLLARINNEKELWSPYGIRSISASSPYYLARNTKDDAPYWRGAVWMPINYLLLSSLREYAKEPGELQAEIITTHTRLRQALIKNIAKEFERTGYLWENYDDRTGEGHGSHPFTGWTSLVLLVMAEPDLEVKN